ncbi:U3 small nucleolar ribonucleoprotein Lcp5 [Histoplasma capsulatum var. duboisii H88]|uniref:U3 small nucleolar ribonucleoprotein Lcp5 n=2 Tax=Ajellomyces capsulatus TaxID=5037 RepID=F0UW83_AJEC8|nr:U3 small nucleolar ribonucleoprotein Lcp5 [Histoplasma capsulatum H143]EGC42593.1 U3 small nucleolar ribonucleoprotein Lcp5 [Histoplasma capsulatum var. duboisii H88]QSS48646.1 U3 small nucleolar ribonucleoprotein Lcp5 [Histoplasma capsulatum var. duboisii H88]
MPIDIETTSAPAQSLSSSLETLTATFSSALASLPTSLPHEDVSENNASILPPLDGISLLDTKNEIFLSYLQNLVFVMLLQLRKLPMRRSGDGMNGEGKGEVTDAPPYSNVVKKLTELRVFLERGVRPLEGQLKYQVDKVLKAADDVERNQRDPVFKRNRLRRGTQEPGDEDNSGLGSDSDSDGDSDGDEDVDELAYRPNVAAFSRGTRDQEKSKVPSRRDAGDGIYRPPKIKPTALPTTTPDSREQKRSRHTAKSAVIDEFVSAEMSSAPVAEPSIGTTIRAGGRMVRSEREKAKELERRAYEEGNFVRLPKESKKERQSKRGEGRPAGYGGEDWRSLGEGADRIERLTRRGRDSGRSTALDKSRKRRATEDGPRGGSMNIGANFEKRRRKIGSWKR